METSVSPPSERRSEKMRNEAYEKKEKPVVPPGTQMNTKTITNKKYEERQKSCPYCHAKLMTAMDLLHDIITDLQRQRRDKIRKRTWKGAWYRTRVSNT